MDDLNTILQHINPAACSYQEWIDVGMALKHEGYTAADWDRWSQNDSRYKSGECFRKWGSFNGAATPVTAGTIVQIAKDQGWQPERDLGTELSWDGWITKDAPDENHIDTSWIEKEEIKAEPEGKDWKPHKEIIRYLEALFHADEKVGYVFQAWQPDGPGGRWTPASGGSYDRTAGRLIEELQKCKGDIGKVFGDYNPEAGAWIRFNPLDGKGVRNDNVTEYRYALVESDDMDLELQNALIRKLELPVAALVYSGGKSIHAIVHIDAADYDDYKKRVDFLYTACKKNGLKIDTQNKNPSRLSRIPGVERGDKKQYLIDTNIGKSSWLEWQEYYESLNDNLPDFVKLNTRREDLPALAEPLIDNVLRVGHKMLLVGPSKAGKSIALMELAIAIAEGSSWMGWKCKQGRVLYVNLELDANSCLHRFWDIYDAHGITPKYIDNLDIWNLRGNAVPMDKLAPKLIRRAIKENYIAAIIDPIYKVLTGDENSADQMARFCNQFDKIANEIGCAVIYCHHHSKGAQGGKRSMDRASGSGVFARDPDALLDMIELPIDGELRTQQENKAISEMVQDYLSTKVITRWNWVDDLSQKWDSSGTILELCKGHLSRADMDRINEAVIRIRETGKLKTAWRIDGTLREFPRFMPVNVWFDYPKHTLDEENVLSDVQPDDEKPFWKKGLEQRGKKGEHKKDKQLEKFDHAFAMCSEGGDPSLQDIANYMNVKVDAVRKWFTPAAQNVYKEHYEKYLSEDGLARIRAKAKGMTEQ